MSVLCCVAEGCQSRRLWACACCLVHQERLPWPLRRESGRLLWWRLSTRAPLDASCWRVLAAVRLVLFRIDYPDRDVPAGLRAEVIRMFGYLRTEQLHDLAFLEAYSPAIDFASGAL